MMNKIKFIKKQNDMVYSPEKRSDTFYQICQFKNQSTGLYETRKIIFDQNDVIKRIYEKAYDNVTLEKFMKGQPCNKYKLFPVYFIKDVALPNSADMSEVRSSLINNDSKIYENQEPDI